MVISKAETFEPGPKFFFDSASGRLHLAKLGGGDSAQTDLVPMVPHVPGNGPYFLDQSLDPGASGVAAYESFVVALLNVSPPSPDAAHQKVIPTESVLLFNCRSQSKKPGDGVTARVMPGICTPLS